MSNYKIQVSNYKIQIRNYTIQIGNYIMQMRKDQILQRLTCHKISGFAPQSRTKVAGEILS